MPVSFLQSYEWGEILKGEGKQVERLDGEAQFVYQKIFFGWQYVFAPGGNINNVDSVVDYFKQRDAIFVRFEPKTEIQNSRFQIQKTTDITPRATIILDLTKLEEELLAGMHEKTRYNIHLAQKKNLTVNQDKNFESFWTLIKQTGERDKFRLHEKRHYQEIFKSSLSHQLTILGDRPIATGVFIGFGDTFTYLFGASDYEQRNLMAPYLLQWEGIKLAKKLGYKKYDFFGITPPSTKNPAKHQYAGVTRFKLGFGGSVAEKPGTYDLIISPVKYKIYKLLRIIRRWW